MKRLLALCGAVGLFASPALAQDAGSAQLLAAIKANTAASNALISTLNTSIGAVGTNTSGAAKDATVSTGNGSLGTIATNTSGVAKDATIATGNAALASINTGVAKDATLATANTLLTTANGLLTAANQANATYVFKKPGGASESSAAASYTFTQTGQRAIYAVCPSTETAAFADANGGTIAWPLVSGGQFLPFLATGFSGNTAGCSIGLLF